MSEDRISVDIQGGVADVRLIRADKMNALDNAMFEALVQTGERLKGEKGVRAVVLSGEGRAFCAGLDTSNFAAMASGGRSGGQSSAGGGLVTANRTAGGSNRAQHAVMVDTPATSRWTVDERGWLTLDNVRGTPEVSECQVVERQIVDSRQRVTASPGELLLTYYSKSAPVMRRQLARHPTLTP